jgi:hypothetical protein
MFDFMKARCARKLRKVRYVHSPISPRI